MAGAQNYVSAYVCGSNLARAVGDVALSADDTRDVVAAKLIPEQIA